MKAAQTRLQQLTASGKIGTAKVGSKYRAVRCELDGEKFDSKREMNRWAELVMLQKAGKIRDLKRQQHFELCSPLTDKRMNAISTDCLAVVGHYVADFTYSINSLGTVDEFVVEDCKGFRTALYRWKKKHFEAQYGREILET